MQQPYSFYVVFNPLLNGENENYKTQAHEFFHRLKENLLSGDSSKAHFYWGKLRMSDHEESLDFERFVKAHDANQKMGMNTHLFISDFHHYWVGKVESVHREVLDKENTLPFYDGKDVEIWFKVSDMDLISSEYVETGYYLEQLYARNVFSDLEINSVNPYLSGLRYPLIVQDRLAEQYFVSPAGNQKPRALGDNPLIENPGVSGKVASNVQTYVLPPAIYGKLSERVKKRLIGVEMKIYQKESANDGTKSKEKDGLGDVIAAGYKEILEDVLNDTFARFVREETSGEVLCRGGQARVSLENMLEILKNPAGFKACNLDSLFGSKPGFFQYCRKELLDACASPGFEALANGRPVELKEAMLVRNMVLGVGCKGIVNSLVCLFYEDEFMDSYFRKVA